jgi:hypothetical protein
MAIASVDDYVVFSGVSTGNFNEVYAEVLRDKPNKGKQRVYKVPRSIIPKNLDISKKIPVRFELLESEFKKLKYRNKRKSLFNH